jgi:hypothetical protein
VAKVKRAWKRPTRDTVLFGTGLAGIAHETLIANTERPTLLFAFMAMVGLPAFLRADEKDAPPPPSPPTPPPEPAPTEVQP